MDSTTFGTFVTIAGIIWTIIGIISNQSIKKSLLKEKDMIKEKILDFKSRLNVYQERLKEDKKLNNNENLNTIHVRIIDIDSIVNDLERFSIKLSK